MARDVQEHNEHFHRDMIKVQLLDHVYSPALDQSIVGLPTVPVFMGVAGAVMISGMPSRPVEPLGKVICRTGTGWQNCRPSHHFTAVTAVNTAAPVAVWASRDTRKVEIGNF
ncbi:hypothetical protein B0H17DRAFT_1200255 [Mycena rosella]|uniref:Uncharacterized protein n=1 Tax=Mycena rosella TaxID=1033263 RepID=A0AAD7GK87_MYCRO|nr:hypothetical protein B0H17DRAFT_1200255 [Mycena rosella]